MKTNPFVTAPAALSFTAMLCLGLLLSLSNCYYDVEDELYPTGGSTCDTLSNNYTLDVVPLLNRHCISCHPAQGGLGGISLTPHANLIVHVNSGLFMCSIRQSGGCQPMPRNAPKIADCDIQTFQNWIDAGALNN